MKNKGTFVLLLAIILALPLSAHAKKGNVIKRGILEKMQAVPCGAKERGLAGVGALWASAGITHINSKEKLCPQYLLRTDQMDYEIRPIDLKHATILPIGKEGEFWIRKDEMVLTMPEGPHQKARTYEVVSMNPANTDAGGANPDAGAANQGTGGTNPAAGGAIPNASGAIPDAGGANPGTGGAK